MKKLLYKIGSPGTALLLGILLTFAFAPYQIFPLAVLSPAGLLALWLNASPKRAFWLGFSFGLGFFGAGVYWVYISIHDIGEVSALLSLMIMAGFITFLACYPALVGYLYRRFFSQLTPINQFAAFPAIWVASEKLRSWLFTGFPWLILGYSQTNSPLKGFAPILGVYGISFMLLISSALLVNSILKFKQKAYFAVYLNLLFFSLLWIAGTSLCYLNWTKPEGKPLSVALVQGNIPQTIKWSPDSIHLSLERYTQLTKPLWGKNQLVIWPETAIPLPLQTEISQSLVNELNEQARRSQTQLILGIPVQASADGYYNAIITLGKQQKWYLKRFLVPFGEYTPFASSLNSIFKFFNIPMSDIVPGAFYQGPLVLGDIKILASICYEIAFPELIRFNDPSISFLLNLTNDAWFGKSSAHAQHLQMAIMRALEFQRPTLFVSNDGITAIIDADGNVSAAAPERQTYVLTGSVQPMAGVTPWMRYGSDTIMLLMMLCLFLAMREKFKAIRLQQQTLHSSEQNNNVNIN